MYCDGDIIKVTENYHLLVETDNDSENPLEWGWGTRIHEIDNYRIWRGWEDSPENELEYMALNLHYLYRRGVLTLEKRDRAIHLYMVWLGDTRSFEIQQYQGYSQSDWATCLVLWDAEDGGNAYEAWAAWRRGDVFSVTERIRKVYVSPEDPDDVYEDWFDGENIGGCYLDDKYTAKQVAKEHFEKYPKEVSDSE